MCETTETLKRHPVEMRRLIEAILRCEKMEKAIRDFLEPGGGGDSTVGNAA